MAALTDYLSRRGEILVLVLVIVLSVTLMVLAQAEKDAVVRLINDMALTPVQIGIERIRSLHDLGRENESLRTELAGARLEIASLEEAGREAERLRRMLGFRDLPDRKLIAARLIAHEAARTGRDLKLDRGARDGIRRNLAVVTVDGLVGKVSAAAPRSAYVRPILGPGCRVSARLSRTRTDGILEWTHDRGLQLSFLPLRAEVKIGDEIRTSGLGGVFPTGIPVGRVAAAEIVPADGSLRVLVEPLADFNSLEEVFVVVEAEFPDDPTPTGPAPGAEPATDGSKP